MINNSYLPMELHNLNNARFRAANVKYRYGDTFEKFIEDSFEETLAGLENYSADYGLHVSGQINNEYDVIVYKDGPQKQIQSVFELKDRDLEGIFSIYHKYVKFINQNKGRVYKTQQNGEEVVYPKNIEYFGLINLSRTKGNIYSLVSEYSAIILNQMFKIVGKNFRKLYDITTYDVIEAKNTIDKFLDEIRYYFISINKKLNNKKQPKSKKSIISFNNKTNNINNNGQQNIGFYLVEDLGNREGVKVVDGKNIIKGIKNNCILIDKKTNELNRYHIDVFILKNILSKKSLEKVLKDNFYSNRVKQISLVLMSSILKYNIKNIDENLVKLDEALKTEKQKISKKKNGLEKTLIKLPNHKKGNLREKINQMNTILRNIPTKEEIYNYLKSKIPDILNGLSKIYDINVRALLKKVYNVNFNYNNKYNKNRNLNEFGHYLPAPNLNIMRGGKKTVYIKGVGNRKVRYYKNGNPYVIVRGKKKRI